MGEGADLGRYHLTAEYNIIFSVYVDHFHCNGGTRLEGVVAKNEVCQCRWWSIGNLSMRWYNLLLGHIGRRFLERLTVEYKRLRTKDWNSERPLVFVAAILPMKYNIWSSNDTCVCIRWWM